MFPRRVGIFCISVAVVLFLQKTPFAETEEQEDLWGPEIGSEAPTIDLEDTDGKNKTIADLRGDKEGLLVFFCDHRNGFRDQLLSDMQELFEQFAEGGFAIVAITKDEIKANKKNKRSLKLKYPLLSDHQLEGARKFGVVFLDKQEEEKINPGVVLIDSDNKVILAQKFSTLQIHYDHVGGSYSNEYFHEPSVEEILQSLLKLPTESKLDKDSDVEE
ncbi:MAG: redoxin domain-containing protein [Gammaproteobacteria bacterium]|nr:redoxin domain-containing protein [Gammaproteobacteria bacterium]